VPQFGTQRVGVPRTEHLAPSFGGSGRVTVT
jgi:hypothetical protein